MVSSQITNSKKKKAWCSLKMKDYSSWIVISTKAGGLILNAFFPNLCQDHA